MKRLSSSSYISHHRNSATISDNCHTMQCLIIYLSRISFVLLLASSSINAAQYVAPGECTWTHSSLEFDVALNCVVRTINPNGLNFSLIQSEHTTSLNVVCDDNLIESRLDDGALSHLRTLRSLAVLNCRLPALGHMALAGLQQLRNLTIRTHTPGPGGLILSPVSLENQRAHLEYLDLGFNAMSQLPADIFCPLTTLKVLNLTRNQLTSFSSLGVVDHTTGHLCLQELQELDLSHNRIRLLSEQGVASLKNLRALYLHNDQISQVAELSLSALSRLAVIDLSHNQLTSLPSRAFRELSELRQLYLQNNSLSQLPTELFAGLSKLFVLNLSHNEITSDSLNSETFADLIRMVILDLGYNRLRVINGSIFQSQYSLQVVNLNDNEIEHILDHSFSSLYNLDTLVLTGNRLKQIESFTLNGLYVLKKLQLDENEIQHVHDHAFANCSTLQELSMDGNLLTEVPKAVGGLKRLKTLHLRDNALLDIKNAPYLGLQQLETLSLSQNKIVNLSRGSLADLPALKRVDLASNRLRQLDHGVFDDAPGLRAIHLENNLLTDINGLFMNLGELRELNVSRNRISWFDYALISKNLERLDLHANKIEDLGNYFEVSSQLALTWLDISRNALKSIGVNTLPDRIVYFNAAHNAITTIHQFSFKNKPALRFVDLRNNSLAMLDANALQLEPPVASSMLLPEFLISDNPYYCDCNMEWMQRINENIASGRYPRIPDLESVQCTLPFSRDSSLTPLLKANSSNFLCKYKSHCFALCHCCDFDACDCAMMCPENCTCFYDQTWNTNLVDCSAKGYQSIPARIPMDVTELYVDGNDMGALSSHTFIGRKNMRSLYLNHSRIHTIANRTFNGLQLLQVLHLEHNQVSALHGYEFESLSSLRELHLHHNRISIINNNTFFNLKSLQVLHLEHNMIFEYQVWNLNHNRHLAAVYFADNPWSCNCRSMESLQDWLQVAGSFVRDSDRIQCRFNSSSNGFGPMLWEFNSSICANQTNQIIGAGGHGEPSDRRNWIAPSGPHGGWQVGAGGSSNGGGVSFLPEAFVQEYLAIAVGALCGLLLVLVIMILMCLYRKEMKVWMYSKYGVRLFARSRYAPETERLFDAFVSYCKKDEAFIAQILAPELECGHPPYRLCLRYRDLPVSGYVHEAIQEAIESSHRTIILLSEQYLKSDSCRYELKVAHQEFQVNRNHQLVVVLLDKNSLSELDADGGKINAFGKSYDTRCLLVAARSQ